VGAVAVSPPPGPPPGPQAGPNGTFFVHGDYGDGQPFNPNTKYNGNVDCKQTCGAYGAEAVGARSVCNVYQTGQFEDCTYETSGGPELDIHCPVWVDRFELHPEGKACANFADIVGTTPDNFPILSEGVTHHSIQCQCLLSAPPPLPPLLLPPPSPSTPPLPPPPPIACDQLVDDEGACGQANAGAICRHCCSANDVCGTDDGAGPWCGQGSQLEYSYAKIDPDATECPPRSVKHHTVAFQPAQCIINPATGKSHCMSLPVGYDINNDSDPMVANLKRSVFDR